MKSWKQQIADAEKRIKGVKKKNKFNAVKNGVYDSTGEGKYYNDVLLPLLRAKKISKLERLNNKKDFTVVFGKQKIIKNGKQKTLRAIKYTPDFYFYNISSNSFSYLPDGIHCYLEWKGEATAKLSDYGMRKKLFISKLGPREAFIEVVNIKSKLQVTVFLGSYN